MPIYDFRCQQCGKVSEIFVRSVGGHATRCPDCDSENLERLISASYVIRMDTPMPGTTCCSRTERCQTPSCSIGGTCQRQ